MNKEQKEILEDAKNIINSMPKNQKEINMKFEELKQEIMNDLYESRLTRKDIIALLEIMKFEFLYKQEKTIEKLEKIANDK